MLVAYAEQRSRERSLASRRNRRALPRYAYWSHVDEVAGLYMTFWCRYG